MNASPTGHRGLARLPFLFGQPALHVQRLYGYGRGCTVYTVGCTIEKAMVHGWRPVSMRVSGKGAPCAPLDPVLSMKKEKKQEGGREMKKSASQRCTRCTPARKPSIHEDLWGAPLRNSGCTFVKSTVHPRPKTPDLQSKFKEIDPSPASVPVTCAPPELNSYL